MERFQLVQQDIRVSAAAMEDLASDVRRVRPGEGASEVREAMPGSQSAGAAARLADAWEQRFRAWSADAAVQGEKRDASASSYDRSDQEAADRISYQRVTMGTARG